MNKIEVRLTQVYRINGRLVVANSIEGAITTWREWNQPSCPDIRSIERIGNDSYQAVGDDALVCAEGLCGDLTSQYVEDIARLNEERDRLKLALEKAQAYAADLERQNLELSAGAGK